MTFHIIIPARYNSKRLPGKLLMDLHGKTVLERVYLQAMQTKAMSITIATDHELIVQVAESFGAPVILTDACHLSGTERLAEAVSLMQLPVTDCVVNVQGDEPFIAPQLINQVAENLLHTTAPMATLCWPIIDAAMACDPNIVKVVRDIHNYALYFSRSIIPFQREQHEHTLMRHIGIYAYKVAFLQEMMAWEPCVLEAVESLEQLRVLWMGYRIHVAQAVVAPLQDINTLEDLERARDLCLA